MIQEPLNDRALRTTYILRRDARAIRNNLTKKKIPTPDRGSGEGYRHTQQDRERVCVYSGWRIMLLDESDREREKVEKQNATGWNVSVDSARSATQDRSSSEKG